VKVCKINPPSKARLGEGCLIDKPLDIRNYKIGNSIDTGSSRFLGALADGTCTDVDVRAVGRIDTLCFGFDLSPVGSSTQYRIGFI